MPNIITNLHVSNLLKRLRATQVPLAGRMFETAALNRERNITKMIAKMVVGSILCFITSKLPLNGALK